MASPRYVRKIRKEIDRKTVTYAYQDFPQSEDFLGYYLPDEVVGAVVAAASKRAGDVFKRMKGKLGRHVPCINTPEISFEQARELVVAAFTTYDPRMGAKAAEVLNDRDRLELRHVVPGSAEGYYRQGKLTYALDGTINDPVYLAHELGHLLNDDWLNEHGYTKELEKWRQRTPDHMFEIQAFFAQAILYDYLLNAQPDAALANAARAHKEHEMARSVIEMTLALAALEAGRDEIPDRDAFAARLEKNLGPDWRDWQRAMTLEWKLDDPESRRSLGTSALFEHPMAIILATGLYGKEGEREKLVDVLFGRQGIIDIVDVLEVAGIDTEAKLATFVEKAVADLARNDPEKTKITAQKPGRRPLGP